MCFLAQNAFERFVFFTAAGLMMRHFLRIIIVFYQMLYFFLDLIYFFSCIFVIFVVPLWRLFKRKRLRHSV